MIAIRQACSINCEKCINVQRSKSKTRNAARHFWRVKLAAQETPWRSDSPGWAIYRQLGYLEGSACGTNLSNAVSSILGYFNLSNAIFRILGYFKNLQPIILYFSWKRKINWLLRLLLLPRGVAALEPTCAELEFTLYNSIAVPVLVLVLFRHRLRSTWRYECFEAFDWPIRR